MAGVSHFQRYSQRENHVTNNVLLVLRHLYQTAPAKLEQVIGELLGQDRITLGPTFAQQTRESASVPDGLIAQAPFRLYLETKLGPALDFDQLDRHIQSIVAARQAAGSALGDTYLLGLATAPAAEELRARVSTRAAQNRVVFAATTFSDLIAALEAVCAPHDVALRAILDDFADYLQGEKLLLNPGGRMLVAPCGASLIENERFGVYYADAEGPRRSPCDYFGAYDNKAIRLVGRVECILTCDFGVEPWQLIEKDREAPSPEIHEDACERIRGIVEATTSTDLRRKPHRFWVMDALVKTTLSKRTKGPVRGIQYLDLAPLLRKPAPEGPFSATQLAELLDKRAFPALDGNDP